MKFISIVALALCVNTAMAQSSTNYQLESHQFTSITTAGEQQPSSASASLSLAGSALVDGRSAAATGFSLDAGHVGGLAPSSGVSGVLFTSPEVIQWGPTPRASVFNLYRNSLAELGSGGLCEESGVVGRQTTDASTPTSGDAFFYLVTSVNRLGEESTTGNQSNGTPRANPSPCP